MVDFAAVARSVVSAFRTPPPDPLTSALAKRAMLGKPNVEVEMSDEEFDALQAYDEAQLAKKASTIIGDELDAMRGKVRDALDPLTPTGQAGDIIEAARGKARLVEVEDPVHNPRHYNVHPSGVECITITEHFTFNLGNTIKYIWRAGEKGSRIEDLEKARWYLDREIAKLKAEGVN